MSPQNSHARINGLAIFAAATFALGVATIAALDRVGAPAGLVRAAGPILALLTLAVVGLGARSASLASYLAARRSVPPVYGALGLAAVAAGIALSLDPGLSSSSDPPPLGVAAGIALGAAAFGPLLRRFGATSLSDVVATRFSRSPIPVVSAIVAFTTAMLTAFAGYQIAVASMEALATPNRLWAETIVAAVLVLIVVPGGLAGVIWGAAASAGELAIIVVCGFAAAWRVGVASPLPGAALHASFSLTSPAALAPLVATTLAVAGFFALQAPAFASRSAGAAVKSGLAGSMLCAALAAMAVAALSAFPADLGPQAQNPVAASLIGAATLACALALAGVGVHASSRAFGVALAEPPRPFPTPSSVRLARMRGAQLAAVIGCAICDNKGLLDARIALIAATALSLALTTPIVALAAIPRVGPFSASVAILAALAVIAFLAFPMTRLPSASEAIEGALAAAAAAFVAGALASLVAPRRGPPPTPGPFDPYAEASG